MSRKKYGMMLGLLGGLATTTTFAQDSTSTSDDWLWDSSKVSSSRMAQHNAWVANQTPYPARPKDKLELGIGLGNSFMFTPIDPNYFGYGAGISLRKAFSHVFSGRLQYNYSVNYGMDYRLRNASDMGDFTAITSAYGSNNNNFLANYKTNFHQISLDGIVSLNTINNYRGNPKTNIYVLGGYSLMIGKTGINAFDASGNAYNWASSGVNWLASRSDIKKAAKDLLNDNQSNSLFKAVNDRYETAANKRNNGTRSDAVGSSKSIVKHAFDLGGGVAFKISDAFNIGIEQKFTFIMDQGEYSGMTIAKQQRGSILSATQVRFNFNLGSSAKRVAPLWWINPNNYIYNELNIPKHMKIILPDADGDGVTDAFDLEPNTPAGAPVDTHGRALDTDGDGVPDYKDKQKITPQSWFPVDADGVGTEPEPACCKELRDSLAHMQPKTECAIVSLPSVQFSKGSVKLSKAAQASLATVAAQLNANPGCKVKVIGYGASNKKAQQLSWDRVNSVIKYLVENQGISEGRLLFYYGQDGDANTVDLQGTTEEGPNTVPAPHPNLQKSK